MPRCLRLTVPLALLVLLLPGVVRAEEKTFENKNFKLDAADDWEWMELSSELEGAGYVARLRRSSAGTGAQCDIRVVPTNDLSLAEMSQEIKDVLAQGLTAVQASKIMKGKLSGLECDLVLIKGIDNRDNNVLIKAYNLQVSGTFHQMIFILVSGAETKQAKEIDALRRAYRLLKGAGPVEEEPEDLGEDMGLVEGEGGSARQEGRTIEFPSHNLRWTLPEGSIFQFTDVTSNESAKEGQLCRAVAKIEHEPPKGSDKKEPQVQKALVLLTVFPKPTGWEPKGVVNNPQNHTAVEESFFDKVDFGRMKIIEELPVGNVTGAAFQMVGTKDEEAMFFRLYAVGLKGESYVIRVLMQGDGTVEGEFKQPVKELLEGIEFIDTFTWIRGPLAIPGVPDADQARGSNVDEEKEFVSLGFEAEKPKGMASINFQPAHTGGTLRIAWEKRSDDKTKYLYFDVQSWPKSQTREVRDFDQGKVKEREGQWLEHASSPNTIKKGKEPWFKSKFGKARGLGYEFSGYLADAPFVEEGYVVEYKDYVYWIRLQLGGKDADKVFAKDVKTLKKCLKFSR